MSDAKMTVSFMIVMTLTFTLCYIANQWWLFLVIMVLYLVRQGIKQYQDNKEQKVRVEMSSAWKFMITIIFLIQVIQVGALLLVYDYVLKEDLFNVLLNTYERLDSANALDKALGMLESFNHSSPIINELDDCYHLINDEWVEVKC